MTEHSQSGTSGNPGPVDTSAIIDRLRQPLLIESQSALAWRGVMAIRLVAACSRADHDPLTLLTQRFASITASKAIIEFAEVLCRYWPEPILVMRPCCRILSPDELTLALLLDAAAAGQRERFGDVLGGLMRSDRHDNLFEHAKEMVAWLP